MHPPCAPRRHLLTVAAAALLTSRRAFANDSLAAAMRRAEHLRNEAVSAGDQPYGAVVLLQGRIVGEGPSRVVQRQDPTAHAETEALRDAARRLGRSDLAGAVLVSTSRPCSRCEAFAARARIARMVYSDSLIDAGAPR